VKEPYKSKYKGEPARMEILLKKDTDRLVWARWLSRAREKNRDDLADAAEQSGAIVVNTRWPVVGEHKLFRVVNVDITGRIVGEPESSKG
jgi:hypothetical protein